jgi:hypothetical protein
MFPLALDAIDKVNSVDPGSYVFISPINIEAQGLSSVREFARKMNALLDLLDATADALAAEWDIRARSANEVEPLNGLVN